MPRALALLLVLILAAPCAAKGKVEEYAERKAKLTQKADAGGLLRLAKWCRKKGLFAEEEEATRLALKADGSFSKAKKALAKLEEKQRRHRAYETPWRWTADLFTVTTNTTEARLHFYAQAFASFYDRFRKTFNLRVTPLKAWGRRIQIKVWRTRADFERFQNESGGTLGESTVGYYDPNTFEIVLYEDPKKLSDTVDTLFHEGTHLLTDLALWGHKAKEFPLWLNEGLAEYFGPSAFDRNSGEIVEGVPSENRLWHSRSLVKKNRAPSLQELLTLTDSAAFEAEHYSMAWALTHMLISKKDTSGKKPKPKFRKKLVQLYARLAAGGEAAAVFEEVFGELAPLERELHEYIRTAFPKGD